MTPVNAEKPHGVRAAGPRERWAARRNHRHPPRPKHRMGLRLLGRKTARLISSTEVFGEKFFQLRPKRLRAGGGFSLEDAFGFAVEDE
jgi:hypothetical protein